RATACLILIAMAHATAKGQSNPTTGLVWLAPSDSRLELNGFPSPPKTATMRNGSRLRLRTDSPTLAVRFTIESPLRRHIHMHGYSQGSLSIYVDDRYLTTVTPTELAPSGPWKEPPYKSEVTVFRSQARRMRSITVYAPMSTCLIEAVGVSADA